MVHLTITPPLTLENIPSAEEMLEAAIPLITESESWKLGKKYDHHVSGIDSSVQTISRPKGPTDGASWHGRVSEHSKDVVTWDECWKGLGIDHSIHEAEYFPELTKATCLKKINESQEIWTLHYHLNPPISNRLFTVVILSTTRTDPSTSLRVGYIVTLPVDVSADPELAKQEEPVTRGFYTSAERISERPDGGVNWRMITSSVPGGYIPAWVSDRAMPGKIQEDVPRFLEWTRKKREAASTADTAS